jgi:hypothetical protein
MRSRILLVLSLVAALALVSVATAAAPAKKTRNLDVHVKMARIDSNPPSGFVFAGEAKGKPIGTAAMTARNQVSGSSSTGTAVVYAKRGTIRATIKNEIQPQPDGSTKLPGTFKITGGSGRYKGATGSGTFDGSSASGSLVLDVDIKGKIRY